MSMMLGLGFIGAREEVSVWIFTARLDREKILPRLLPP